ncbi:DUF2892 domain-containing protein [Halobacteriovorax sp. ZH4_bin.1]|uniref:YgaP family membrane protein n=1 Tax=unclassified Halobacteriovorax TaxID=2639665 RepID=UPI0037239E3E
MKMNEGNVDRFIRIIVGMILISLVVIGPKTYWGLIGVIPLVTGILGICPGYLLFGFSTRLSPPKNKKAH